MKTVVTFGVGSEIYRGYILEALRKINVRVILIAPQVPNWILPLIYGYLPSELENEQLIINSLREIQKSHSIDGAISLSEEHVPLMISVQQSLKLPGPDYSVARNTRHKGAMRQALGDIGLQIPKVLRIPDIHTFSANDALLPEFPLVLKPARGSGSFNVQRVNNLTELNSAAKSFKKTNALFTFKDASVDYLLESFIEGDEFSIESVVSGTQVKHFAIVRKYTTELPFFEEFAHIAGDDQCEIYWDEFTNVVERCVRGMSIDAVATHTEIKRAPDGPYIIEIGARLGGDLIPKVVALSTGQSPIESAAMACMGKPLPVAPIRTKRTVGVLFFVPRQNMQLNQMPVKEKLERCEGVLEVALTAKVGDTFYTPPIQFMSRLGHVICEGKSRVEVEMRLNAVVGALEKQLDTPFYTI